MDQGSDGLCGHGQRDARGRTAAAEDTPAPPQGADPEEMGIASEIWLGAH